MESTSWKKGGQKYIICDFWAFYKKLCSLHGRYSGSTLALSKHELRLLDTRLCSSAHRAERCIFRFGRLKQAFVDHLVRLPRRWQWWSSLALPHGKVWQPWGKSGESLRNSAWVRWNWEFQSFAVTSHFVKPHYMANLNWDIAGITFEAQHDGSLDEVQRLSI